jgi:hypothetical protein
VAIQHGYATLDEVKRVLGIASSDQTEDGWLELCIEGASRQVDLDTGRHFYPVTETRAFTATDASVVAVDDLISITSLTSDDNGDRVYETTWATTDYDTEPYNRLPITAIRFAHAGVSRFPDTIRRGVLITGEWGYGSVPATVRTATVLYATRYFRRPAAPFGIVGSAEMGTLAIGSSDPDIKRMLRPLARFRAVLA